MDPIYLPFIPLQFPPISTPLFPPNLVCCSVCLFLIPTESISCCFHVQESGTICETRVPSRPESPKKSDSSSPSSCQSPITPQIGAVLHEPLPHLCWMTRSCAGLVHAVTVVVSSCMQLLCYICKDCFAADIHPLCLFCDDF